MSAIAPDFWPALAAHGPAADAWRVRAPLPHVSPRLLGCLGGSGGRKWVVALGPDEADLDDRRSRGVLVGTVELVDEVGAAQRHLVLECREAAGHAWFDLVGAELAVALGTQPPAQAAARVLAKWRRFWGQVPRDLLTREQQIGLFAEVWFLSRWLIPAAGVAAAVSRWRGPLGARRDFEWPGRAVEVKGSTVVRGPVFRIHGLDQLDPPGAEGRLWFFALRLREDGAAEHTLPSLVAECRGQVEPDGDALGRLEMVLAEADYSPLHEADYVGTRWRVVSERLYPVDAGFPRLGSEDFPYGLPPGVSELAYTLDLGGYTGASVDDPAAAAEVLR